MALSQTFHSQTKQFVSEGIRLFLFLIFKFLFYTMKFVLVSTCILLSEKNNF